MELKNKQVLVVGTGISGIAATKLLHHQGANIILYDGNEQVDLTGLRKKLNTIKKLQIVLGTLSDEVKQSIDLVVVSPGVPTDLPFLLELKEKQIPMIGEIELAYLCGAGNIVAITGTNGKTTTTALTGEIMKAHFSSTFVVGNIGIPYTEVTLDTNKESVIVAEVSSFQLETIESFHPQVSAILNITEDHLNRHHTMENYIHAKLSVTKNQTKEDICVLNYEDEVLRNMAEQIPATVVFFSSKRELESGIYLSGDDIVFSRNGKKEVIVTIHELKLLGAHNYENVMAAIVMADALKVPMDTIRTVVKQFKAVEHRIEYVDEIRGVKYYNDSKGTNPDAAIKAIQAMVTDTYLIAGGYDKDSSYEEWIQSFDGKVKELVLLGQTREKIAEAAKRCGFTNIIFVETLEDAVNECAKRAKRGEAVLLSPACASWGMFQNYEERGDMFKQYVLNLAN